jgi:hypothetical protein
MPVPSPLGTGLSCTFCTVTLPFPDGLGGVVQRAVTTIQFPFGVGTAPGSSAPLPSVTSGRPLLSEAIVRRWSTARGSLPDVNIPTTLGNYGIDILDSANADMTIAEAGALSADLDAQAQQEQRLVTSNTTATVLNNLLVIAANLVDGTGPFRLTIAINVINQNLQLLSGP